MVVSGLDVLEECNELCVELEPELGSVTVVNLVVVAVEYDEVLCLTEEELDGVAYELDEEAS